MFKLFFATPEKKIVSGADLEEISLPGDKGELNILAGHAPLMTSLSPGLVSYRLTSGETGKMAVGWGYAQVSSDGVSVLAESAVTGDEVDAQKNADQLKIVEAKLANETLDDSDWENVHRQIERLRSEIDLSKAH